MRTSNPALKERTFTDVRAAAGEAAMTVEGTASKSLLLLLLVVFAASFTWRAVASGNVGILMPALLVGCLGLFIVALITVFKPTVSPYTAPIYAVLEGLMLGEGTGIGEAFKAFQSYLRALMERGVLLAVSSKNEERHALKPFEGHPEMVLKRDDFVESARAFQAYLRDYPDGSLAPNAWYWLGESYYVTQNYPLALQAFDMVLQSFPDSSKGPDAML